MKVEEERLHTQVVIIGAGFAGLVAAQELKRKGIPFVVLEGSKNIGGLAQTFTDSNGFKFDFGTHLITNRLAKALEIEDQCINVGYFGESVWLKGRSLGYPFGLLLSPQFSISAIVGKVKKMFGKQEKNNLLTKLRQDYGYQLATEIAIPLSEALMGASANDLSIAVSNKIPSILQTLYLRLAGYLTGKTVAIGYCMELSESPQVWHVYPKNGIKTLCDKLISDIEDRIQLETSVDKIYVENDVITGVRSNGKIIPTSMVISTAPLNILSDLIEGTKTLNYLNRFRYRAMVFVNIMVEGNKVLPNVALWVPEKRYPFFRLNEPSYSMPWLAPSGKSMITADIGCNVGDESWNRNDGEWEAFILPFIEEIVPDIRKRILGCKVIKTKYAYPIYLTQYEKERQKFIEDTGIKGLYSVGRNGEFMHILMEDVYIRTKNKIDVAVSELA